MIIFNGKASDTNAFLLNCLSRIGYRAEKLAISRNEKGKPIIKGYNGHLSVSHSEDIIVAAFSDHSVGIDIEYIKERDFHALAARYFNSNEAKKINKESSEEFYRLFTMKEAYYKLSGSKDWLKVTEEEIRREGLTVFQSEYVDGYFLSAICSQGEEIVKA